MGGSGSGSYYRWNSRNIVEDGLQLDLAKLIRQGSVIPGQNLQGRLSWNRVGHKEEIASIGYEFDLTDEHNSWIRLFYNFKDMPKDYKIELSTTKPNYGGLRWWFTCPLSGRRVGKLYKPPGQSLFAARKVFDLSYQSQRETPLFRSLSVAQDIRARLGGSCCIDDPFPDKPKGMHWKTYWRLQDKSGKATKRCMAEAARCFGLELTGA